MMPYSFIVVNIFHCNIAAIMALPLVAIIAGNIFSITQPYTQEIFMHSISTGQCELVYFSGGHFANSVML